MQAAGSKSSTPCRKDDILVLAGSIPASLAQTTYERLLARLEGRGVRCRGGRHARPAGERAALQAVPHQAEQPRAGRDRGRQAAPNDKEIAAAARMLQDKGARNVLVSMAGDGALLLDEHGHGLPHRLPQGQGGQQRGRGRQHGGRFCGRLPAERRRLCRPPCAWAPPAAAPPRSAWVWRQRRILMHCWQRCDAAL